MYSKLPFLKIAVLTTIIFCVCSSPVYSSSTSSPQVTSRAVEINQKKQADAIYNEGRQLFDKGRWRLSMEKYKQALWIYRAIGDKAAMAETLIQLGVAENYLKLPVLSKTRVGVYVKQAVATRNEILEKLGLKDVGDGREFFLEALRIRRELKDRVGESVALVKLGETYIQVNGLDNSYRIAEKRQYALGKASEFYKQAIGIYQGNRIKNQRERRCSR